mmetsp:Transcript_42229/g.99141  ORF Transcript_42229/g.99141 Transcript_42229/m.99141 type:complete len:229 (-) Transcript_42229:525-1211(-)
MGTSQTRTPPRLRSSQQISQPTRAWCSWSRLCHRRSSELLIDTPRTCRAARRRATRFGKRPRWPGPSRPPWIASSATCSSPLMGRQQPSLAVWAVPWVQPPCVDVTSETCLIGLRHLAWKVTFFLRKRRRRLQFSSCSASFVGAPTRTRCSRARRSAWTSSMSSVQLSAMPKLPPRQRRGATWSSSRRRPSKVFSSPCRDPSYRKPWISSPRSCYAFRRSVALLRWSS